MDDYVYVSMHCGSPFTARHSGPVARPPVRRSGPRGGVPCVPSLAASGQCGPVRVDNRRQG